DVFRRRSEVHRDNAIGYELVSHYSFAEPRLPTNPNPKAPENTFAVPPSAATALADSFGEEEVECFAECGWRGPAVSKASTYLKNLLKVLGGKAVEIPALK